MYGTSDRAALKHLFYWLAAATWGHRNCAKSLSSRCTEGQTAVCGIIITLRPDNARAIAALQERGRATETDGRKLGQPISCQQSGWMCELLAGFVSRGRDGHSSRHRGWADAQTGKGREGIGPGASTDAAFHTRERQRRHTLMGALGISRSPRIFAERREYSRSGTDSSRGGCRCLGSVIRQADVFDPSQKRRRRQKQKIYKIPHVTAFQPALALK